MEKKYYNILWIDDQHEGMAGLKGDAKFNSILFTSYKSLNGGISELKRNHPLYDGVLLDAKFFENEDDVSGSEDTYNVHRAKEELLLLPKKFEVFVLTGQAEAYEDKTFNKSFTRVYEKGNDKDIEKLFKDIKAAADQQLDTQIRHEYSRVFDVCTDLYIGETAAHDLLELITYQGCETGKFNQIRKIVEDLFIAFNKYDLLPSEFVKPNVAINPASKFLCGQVQSENTAAVYKKHKLNTGAVLPLQIAYYLRSILTVTQDGSHRSNVDAHVNTLKTPYLLKSVLFQLLDVLVWFKQYVDAKPKTNNWEVLDIKNHISECEAWIEGIITKIAEDLFGTFKSDECDNLTILPKFVKKLHLAENSRVKVRTKPSPDGSKTYIKDIKVLQDQ